MRCLQHADQLLGRRFATEFRVVSVGERPRGGDDSDRPVTLHMQGDRCTISLGELCTLIERGFVAEAGT